MNAFQTAVSIIFGTALIIAVLIFSGILPGFRTPGGGAAVQVELWGTLSDRALRDFWLNFNKENEGTVVVTYIEKSSATFEQELIEALASGKGPDAVILDQGWLEKHKEKLAPLPYSSLPQRQFLDTFAEGSEVFLGPTGAYAVPILINPLVMYYNRDILNAAGWSAPPKTWAEFVEPDKPLTLLDSQGNIIRSALAMGTYGNVDHAKDIIALLLLQAGNPITARDSQGLLSSILNQTFDFAESPAQAVTNFYTQFSDPVKSTYTWNNALPRSRDAFIGGTLATYLGYASELSDLRAKNPHLNLDVTVVPQRDKFTRLTYGQIYAVAVMKASLKPVPAFSAATLLASAKWQKPLATALGLAPIRRDLLETKNLDAFSAVFYESAIGTRTWIDPQPTETDKIFRQMIVSISSGKSKATDAVSRADAELGNLIKK